MGVLYRLIECATHDGHKHVYEDDVSDKRGEEKDRPCCVYIFSVKEIHAIKLPESN